MKYSILILVLAAASTLPAEVQSNTSAQHTEEHSSTQVTPGGTAVEQKSRVNETANTSNSSDGTSTSTRSKSTQSKTKVKSDPAPAVHSTTEDHTSTSTTTTDVVKP